VFILVTNGSKVGKLNQLDKFEGLN
jgi:hypothetical protein